MAVTELRDSETARTWLMQGVWLQRLGPVQVSSLADPLACALALAAADEPIPPLGFIADVIRLIEGRTTTEADRPIQPSGLPAEAVRAYEDYVLGKLYADASFERASIAVCRYDASDRMKAIAWLLARLSERSGSGGLLISPSVTRSLQNMVAEDVLAQGAASLEQEGLLPLLVDGYQHLTQAVRNVGQVLSSEDVFELEHGTALVEFGQRLALRQTLRAAADFAAGLPPRAPRPSSRQRNVPTNIAEEDMYPIGGFTSISTRGTVESLLHSQLAYMEKDEARRPDLFEIKFLRSELLYYSRDENEFLRRRRVYQFVLYPDLMKCRLKDPQARYQRLILLLGLLVCVVRRLLEWLSDDALLFEFLLVGGSGQAELQEEWDLLQMILEEQVSSGTVRFAVLPPDEITTRAEERARSHVTHTLLLSTQTRTLPLERAMPIGIRLADPKPQLTIADAPAITCESFDDALHRLVTELV